MEVKIAKKDFNAALNVVTKSALMKSAPKDGRSPGEDVPRTIYENVTISANGNIALVCRTTENTIKYIVPGEVKKPGITAVNAKSLLQFGKVAETEFITLKESGNHLDVDNGAKNKIKIAETDSDANSVFGPEPTNYVTMPGKVFADELKRVILAASRDDFREALTGIFFGRGRVTSSDGFRISTSPVENNLNAIIPVISIKKAIEIFKKSESVSIGTNETQAWIKDGSCTLVSQKINATFPEWESIPPKSYANSFTVNRVDFLRALLIVGSIVKNAAASLGVVIQISENKVVLSYESEGVGSSAVTLDVKTEIENDTTLALNLYLLVDAVDSCRDESLTYYFNDNKGVGMIKDQTGWKYYLMPMTLKTA
jgi:DNA polymerase III sliding clamp (beta) subunit (PCNA family)